MSQQVPGSSKSRGKKNRKYGRNKKWCEGYRRRGQREKNLRLRLERRLRRNPHDRGAIRALERLSEYRRQSVGEDATGSR